MARTSVDHKAILEEYKMVCPAAAYEAATDLTWLRKELQQRQVDVNVLKRRIELAEEALREALAKS